MRDIVVKDQPIRSCVSCDRFFVGGRWSKDLDRLVSSLVSEPVRVLSVDPEDAFSGRAPKRVSFELAVSFDGEEHVAIIDLPVENTQCSECLKRRSHYFEGFLQLRSGSEDEYDVARSILEANRGYVKEEVRIKDGVDLKVSSNRAIIATLKELDKRFVGTSSTSSSLHTRDHQTSKEKYRVTGLFRFSKVRKGDVIVVDEPVRVEKVKGSQLECRSIRDPKTTLMVDITTAESAERLEPFSSRVIATRPELRILSESFSDVSALDLSGRSLEPDDEVRAVGFRGFYAVLE